MKWKNTSITLIICITIATCLIVATHKKALSSSEALNYYRHANASEKALLTLLCKETFCNSSMAYTLFCDKPMSERDLSWYTSFDEAYFLHRALPILRKYAQHLNTAHFALIVEDLPTRTSLYLINKKAFIDTVQKNIVLFRKILGNTITPKKLLQTILDKQCTIDSALKNNHALIGILFGFGTENSLLFDRRAQIDNDIYSRSLPPWKDPCSIDERYLKQNFRSIAQRKMLIHNSRCYIQEPKTPASSIQTLQEESQTIDTQLRSKTLGCPYYLIKTPEIPAFAANRASEETQALLNKYKAQRAVVQSIVTDIKLPERVLGKFFEAGDHCNAL